MNILALLVVATLAGCKKPPPCLPDEIVQRDAASVGSQSPAARPLWSDLRVYIDGSASMRGFVSRTQFGRQEYAPLLRNLLGLPGRTADAAVSLFRIGPKLIISQNMVATLTDAATPAFYTGDASGDGDLAKALEDAATQPEAGLSLIVTDLYFSGKTINANQPSAVFPLLSSVMQKGKAVLIYGVESAFNGVVYDLPPVPGMPACASTQPQGAAAQRCVPTAIQHEGTRPFFLIVIGKPVLVQAAANHLEKVVFSSGQKLQKALFLLANFDNAQQDLHLRMPPTEAVGVKAGPFPSTDTSLPSLATWLAPAGRVNYSIANPDAWVAGHFASVREVKAKTRIWMAVDKSCTAKRPAWREWPTTEVIAARVERSQGGGLAVSWPGGTSGSAVPGRTAKLPLPAKQIFLVDVEITAEGLVMDDNSGWMDAWNLDPELASLADYRRVFPPGSLFKVRDLAQFRRVLRAELDNLRNSQPVPQRRIATVTFVADSPK